MMDFIIGLFTMGGNTALGSIGLSTASTASSVLDEFTDYSGETSLLLTSTSISSALFNKVSAVDTKDKQVEDMQMLVESMNLEELQELKELVDEKGNSYKLHL